MNKPHRPLAIIQTGLPPDFVAARHGSFSDMICCAADLCRDEISVIPVHEGAVLDAPSAYRAAVITGSPAMVTDLTDWSERTAAWIRNAARQGLPMLGICYGHQLMAHALGGKVGYNPRGREVGTQTVELLDEIAAQALAEGLPAQFPAHLIHQQSVLELPPGAKVLARSAHDAHQIVQYQDQVLSTQYHPEFSTEIMRTYLAHYALALAKEGFDVDSLQAGLQTTPHARQLLLSFLDRHSGTELRAQISA